MAYLSNSDYSFVSLYVRILELYSAFSTAYTEEITMNFQTIGMRPIIEPMLDIGIIYKVVLNNLMDLKIIKSPQPVSHKLIY